MSAEGSTLLSNSQLRGVAGRGVSGERMQLNTGIHRHNLTNDREFKVIMTSTLQAKYQSKLIHFAHNENKCAGIWNLS